MIPFLFSKGRSGCGVEGTSSNREQHGAGDGMEAKDDSGPGREDGAETGAWTQKWGRVDGRLTGLGVVQAG